jgi:hypothetical protein
MAHQRKVGTALKMGVPPMQLGPSLGDSATMCSLRRAVVEIGESLKPAAFLRTNPQIDTEIAVNE